MAKRETRITAVLSGACQYATYIQFVEAHRHRLEGLRAFDPWDVALQRIAEEEGRRLRLRSDNTRQWDLFVNAVVVPIRCSFWYGWESAFDLRKLYEQQVEIARREAATFKVVRVFNPPASPMISPSALLDQFHDERDWDQIASNMADAERQHDRPAVPLPQTPQTAH